MTGTSGEGNLQLAASGALQKISCLVYQGVSGLGEGRREGGRRRDGGKGGEK